MRIKRIVQLYQIVIAWRASLLVPILIVGMVASGGCLFISNEGETYYGRVEVPRGGDFRWSNGGLPQQLDPALAASPPDTDAVRALCEGLTDYDSRSLSVIPGVAQRWQSSEDNLVWTFFLRANARWSNDDPVTAQDFVRSWRRAVALGDQAPHGKLLNNISGIQLASTANGTRAISDHVLRVRLTRPDANFPALVAHPVFYPVHDSGKASIESLVGNHGALPLVTNGAFRLANISTDSVLLERAGNYWDASEVNLHRVRFVAASNAETALAAYRAGEVDALTNAGFEPLALKMLAPYKDFRRATYGALTFYKLNTAKPPFDDVRVRQALALAIDRERISEDEMGGATEPAKKFFPAQIHDQNETKADATLMLEHDAERARQLFADAGFPQGKDFPQVRLLINRNDQQRLVAQAVAAMWQNALGIETEIIVKDWEAYEAALLAGDYDVARRGLVMQTPDEAINLRAMFEPEIVKPISIATLKAKQETALSTASIEVMTEAQALREMPAIPLYFASSYSLIKPYVEGFDANILDAPSLKHVRIDTGWRMPQKTAARVVTSDE